jgi:hypothetical protein
MWTGLGGCSEIWIFTFAGCAEGDITSNHAYYRKALADHLHTNQDPIAVLE